MSRVGRRLQRTAGRMSMLDELGLIVGDLCGHDRGRSLIPTVNRRLIHPLEVQQSLPVQEFVSVHFSL